MAEPVIVERPLADEDGTLALGEELARALPADTAGWLVLLRGELGAGKSTLARALLRALGHAGPVPSPTYTLVEPYDVAGRRLYHVDLYRVASADELDFLGWDDLADGLLLVEWPERAPRLDGDADVAIDLGYAGDGRHARLEARSPRAAEWLARLPDQGPAVR